MKRKNKIKSTVNDLDTELLGKYMARMLYEWDDGKFENEYLKKLERS